MKEKLILKHFVFKVKVLIAAVCLFLGFWDRAALIYLALVQVSLRTEASDVLNHLQCTAIQC